MNIFRIISKLLPILFFLIGGCQGASQNDYNTEDVFEAEKLINTDDNRVDSLAKEALGKMVLRNIALGDISSRAKASSDNSINAGFDAEIEIIDNEYLFSGEDGEAVVKATGGLEIIRSAGSTNSVFYFVPVYLDVNLNSYQYTTQEDNEIIADGEINITFNGRIENGILIGSGVSRTGSFEEDGHIEVIKDGELNIIEYDVTFKAHGDPFDFSSYKFDGNIIINNEVIDL